MIPPPYERRRFEDQRKWSAWIDDHRSELTAIGLPPEVSLSLSHWEDFLENGYLHGHPHDSTRFSFHQLSPGSMAALKRFLEREHGETPPQLLQWLRYRAGER